ncbi:uncharacterized protein An08g10910 [Aspergillus niger]|uniref:Contig An08c0280, genomic contig n=2 Tax=Aspergillus niger TaxID=5061 RepID=A2QSJ1_ASPNC|nr:uncharacterized protein An08g10910 [Aspergillus niger]CAK45763.1 unnamed protein product [Aspergillus niger]
MAREVAKAPATHRPARPMPITDESPLTAKKGALQPDEEVMSRLGASIPDVDSVIRCMQENTRRAGMPPVTEDAAINTPGPTCPRTRQQHWTGTSVVALEADIHHGHGSIVLEAANHLP